MNVKLLDTQECRDYVSEINDFENNLFGDKFATTEEEVLKWVKSNSMICSVILREGNQFDIEAIMSMIVVSQDSWRGLVDGFIKEIELEPAKDGDSGILYVSSMYARNRYDSVVLYNRITDQLQKMVLKHRIHFEESASIPIGSDSTRHLEKSGFVNSGRKYMNEYYIYKLNSADTRVKIWRKIAYIGINGMKKRIT